MGEAYPELMNHEIEKVIEAEERRFLQTLSKGMDILDAAIAENKTASCRAMWSSSCTTPMASRLT